MHTRIFVDAHMLDHGFEGSASFICGVYAALQDNFSDQYTLFFGCADPRRAAHTLGHIPKAEVLGYAHASKYPRLLVDIPRAITRVRADLAHFQYFTPLVKNCPWIVTIHDVLFNDFPEYFPPNYRRIRNVLFPMSARRADILTTVSNYSRGRIAHWYKVPPDRIHVVGNGVMATVQPADDGAIRQPAAPTPTLPPYLLCVSRFEPRKNQSLVLAAYIKARLWERGYQLVFVGSRTLSVPAFDQALAQAPAQARENLRFLEDVPVSTLAGLYAGAAVAIYPSRAEGFGIPPLEALAHGTPSLCARATAMIDFDFLAPYFFDPDDVDSLLQVLLPVLDNPGPALTATNRMAAQMQQRYTWDNAAAQLHQLIQAFRRPAMPAGQPTR
jgi:glycosyltransferase involved in cell wall biosynthesis